MENNLEFNSEDELVRSIKQVIENARNNINIKINNELLIAYWKIGGKIIEFEQNGENRAKYGEKISKILSKELTKIFGKGFSVSNIQYMRRLYIKYPKQQTLSVKLSWSHYCELLSIEDDMERSFYEKETINSNWSIRELKRQKDTSLYHRLLLSYGKINKEKVLKLAKEGQIIEKPQDLIKDPYIFEFLGIPENKPILEKDLEKN